MNTDNQNQSFEDFQMNKQQIYNKIMYNVLSNSEDKKQKDEKSMNDMDTYNDEDESEDFPELDSQSSYDSDDSEYKTENDSEYNMDTEEEVELYKNFIKELKSDKKSSIDKKQPKQPTTTKKQSTSKNKDETKKRKNKKRKNGSDDDDEDEDEKVFYIIKNKHKRELDDEDDENNSDSDSDYIDEGDDNESDEGDEYDEIIEDMPLNIILNIKGLDKYAEYDDYSETDEGDDNEEVDDNEEEHSLKTRSSKYERKRKKECNNKDTNKENNNNVGDIETQTIYNKFKKFKSDDIKYIIDVLDKHDTKQIDDENKCIKDNKEIQNVVTEGLRDIYNEKKKKETKLQDKKDKKVKKKNMKKYRKNIKSKNYLNDHEYFEKQDIVKQNELIQIIEDMNKDDIQEKPYRIKLLESDIPNVYKSIALRKINTLQNMDSSSGEFFKIKHWVDNFMSIPFGKYKHLDISIKDGIEKCNEFMMNAKKTLDDAVYGLNDAKMQIMQMMAQWISNPQSIGTAIAIKGPMGTGKTTLIKDGISKILNRPFAFVALGGATDSSFLEGHSYTYEGSTWGHIVEILKQSKCMNPVIYFDELDKVSDTPKGEEIIGILTHLTDTTQNAQFKDKYFNGIDIDLSKCLFIFSYNDENKVNPILRDRMYKIETEGYNMKDKMTIVKNYLIPSIEQNIGLESEQIEIHDNVISHVIENYTKGEKGVRNLRRCIEIMYSKINMYRLMNPNTVLCEGVKTMNIEFPFTINKDVMDKLLKKDKQAEWIMSMYT
jgi:ATP-dependent Lon protease